MAQSGEERGRGGKGGDNMKLERIAEAAIGLYLILPSVEDAATGGLTLAPSAAVGAVLLADAFGAKL